MSIALTDDNHVTLEVSESFKAALESAFGDDIAVFDLDGTLANDDSRQHLAEKKDWHAYNLASANDLVNKDILAKLSDHFQNNDLIVILTGRMWSPEVEEVTIEWLNKNDIFFDALVMRAPDNTRSNADYKLEWYNRTSKNIEVVHAYDDNPAAIKAWESVGVEATYVQSGSPFYE